MTKTSNINAHFLLITCTIIAYFIFRSCNFNNKRALVYKLRVSRKFYVCFFLLFYYVV